MLGVGGGFELRMWVERDYYYCWVFLCCEGCIGRGIGGLVMWSCVVNNYLGGWNSLWEVVWFRSIWNYRGMVIRGRWDGKEIEGGYGNVEGDMYVSVWRRWGLFELCLYVVVLEGGRGEGKELCERGVSL